MLTCITYVHMMKDIVQLRLNKGLEEIIAMTNQTSHHRTLL